LERASFHELFQSVILSLCLETMLPKEIGLGHCKSYQI